MGVPAGHPLQNLFESGCSLYPACSPHLLLMDALGMQAASQAKPGASGTGMRAQVVQLQAENSSLRSENGDLKQQLAQMQTQLSATAAAPVSASASPTSISLTSSSQSSTPMPQVPADAGHPTSDGPDNIELLHQTTWDDEEASWLSHGPLDVAELCSQSLPDPYWLPPSPLQAQTAQAEPCMSSLKAEASSLREEHAEAMERLQAQAARTAQAEQRSKSLKEEADCLRLEHADAIERLQALEGHSSTAEQRISSLEAEASSLRQDRSHHQDRIAELQAELQRTQESHAAAFAEADNTINNLQQLLAEAAFHESVTLHIAVPDGSEHICKLEADLEASQRRHAADLAQAQDELSSIERHSDILELQLEHSEQQLHAAQSEAESQTDAANNHIGELVAGHSEDIKDLVLHADRLSADACRERQRSANEAHVLQGTIVQLQLQQSLSLWNIGVAVTTHVSRGIFGSRSLL